jgi:hypothetical protein
VTLYRPNRVSITKVAPGLWLINNHVVQLVGGRWEITDSGGALLDACRTVNDAIHLIEMDTPEFRAVHAYQRSLRP